MKPSLGKQLRVRRRAALLEQLESRRLLAAVSPPAFLQWFDSSFDTVEQRTPDIFQAGYGAVWLPPPGRADSGEQSVGYDAYDRFDLGSPDHETLYGTETGLKSVANAFERAGVALQIDAILNHSGFSDQGTTGFVDSGGYPGLAITLPGVIDGDFHSGFDTGVLNGRLSGLVDIDHTTNHQMIRQPVDPADVSNIPPGTTADPSGRLANVPDPANSRFYPDQDGDAMFLFDPVTNESNIPVYSFDAACSSCGDATAENAMGYLMRYMQWMVQIVGVDGFRIDAAQHFEGFVMDYVDRALYRSNPRPLLDGSTDHVFSYSEVFTGDKNTLMSYVKKNIDPSDPGRIGGNRDSLDFSAFFTMRDNLSSMGTANAWQNIRDSLLDVHDDGLHNGSAGVLFVRSHDEFGPAALDNLGHAFALMHPGNAVVYMNGKEFGDGRDFPKSGRGDALGGVYGDTISNLVSIRNSHGRGDMLERWIDNQGIYIFERDSSAVVGLSNRGDSGFDERTVNVNFAPGTHLIELTGNASDPAIDPNDDVPEVLTVSAGGTITMRVPRNLNANNEFHGKGYVIYGLPAPQASSGIELTGIDSILPGSVPSATDYENGRTRLSDLQVVTGDSIQVKLQTEEVNLLGLSSLRDVFADGDNALLRLDGGIDLNGSGSVDFVTPGEVTYGFEQFVEKSSPLVGAGGLGGTAGDGEFLQTIDTSVLAEGTHFLEIRAFRHRTDGGPAIFRDFKESIYVDRLPPESEVYSFEPYVSGVNEDRDLVVRSVDQTADNTHVFLNLAAGLADAEILQMVAAENQARQRDRDQFVYGFSNVPHGNNVATIVSYEPTGNVNVQRVPGLFTSTIIGAGLGDLDFDGDVDLNDTQEFETVFLSENSLFNPSADFNADGQIDYADLDLFSIQQVSAGADQAILDAIEAVRAVKFGAVSDSYSLNENEVYTQTAPGVLANDRDPGSGAMFGISTLGSISSDQGVTVTLAADGAFSYPNADVFDSLTAQQTGTDFFVYSVTDGLGNSVEATVTLTVQGVNDPPTLGALSNISLNEDAAEQVIGLSQVTAGGGESQVLLVTALSDSTNLIPNPEIEYASPNSTGSLKFTPVPNESGMAEIVVTVADGGADGVLSTAGDNATVTRTILVTVDAVNDDPTLDALSDLNIDEDAGEQVIDLEGASAGGDEQQPLRITATSDSPSLIPDPTVIYSSGDLAGTLRLTPVADQSGTAEVVVTIEDGGLDGDLTTSQDNGIVNRSFTVNVAAVNDVPTLDALYAVGLDENAGEQTIALSGIDSGGDEGQLVRVTASSDNTGLLSEPIVLHSEGADSGTLKFTPLFGQVGTAKITVYLEDCGPDGSFSNSEDNAYGSYEVPVGVGVTSFTLEAGKIELRLRESGQNVLIRETINGFSLELNSGVWFGADVGTVSGAGSNLLTFDASSGTPLIELATNPSNSISFDQTSSWRMGEVLNDSVTFLPSVQTVSDPSQRIYLNAAHPWQNVVEPSDITNDGVLSVLDALVAINELGVGTVTNLLTGQLDSPLDVGTWPGYYYDQNGDGRLSTLDALRVLNGLALIEGEGEGEAVLMRSWQPNPKASNSFRDTVTQVRNGDVASEQVTAIEVTAINVTAFKAVDEAFETCLLTSESNSATGSDRQQAIDAVMVNLLHETTGLQ